MNRATRAEINSVRMAEEAMQGLSGEIVVNTLYALACDHPRVTAAQLETLSNRLGRAAHERARYDRQAS